MWETYPPAKADRIIWKFLGVTVVLMLLAVGLTIIYPYRAMFPIVCGLLVIAGALPIVGFIVKYRRWSADPGFQAFLAKKRERLRRGRS